MQYFDLPAFARVSCATNDSISQNEMRPNETKRVSALFGVRWLAETTTSSILDLHRQDFAPYRGALGRKFSQ